MHVFVVIRYKKSYPLIYLLSQPTQVGKSAFIAGTRRPSHISPHSHSPTKPPSQSTIANAPARRSCSAGCIRSRCLTATAGRTRKDTAWLPRTFNEGDASSPCSNPGSRRAAPSVVTADDEAHVARVVALSPNPRNEEARRGRLQVIATHNNTSCAWPSRCASPCGGNIEPKTSRWPRPLARRAARRSS